MSLDMTYNLPVGVTEMSKSIYDLHMLVFYICVGIMVVVSVLLFYVIIKYRKTKSHTTLERGQPHSDFWVEFLWTLIPTIIVLFMMIPATKLIWKVGADDEKAINIRVTGAQWYWQYEYVDDDGVSVMSRPFDDDMQASQKPVVWQEKDKDGNLVLNASGKPITHHRNDYYMRRVDHPLVLPSHRKIRFLITSQDVIHSWFVPAFGIKQDAVPSISTAVWANVTDPGNYYGLCAELCGAHHAHMPIVVLVRAQEEYDAYIEELKEMKEKGVTGLTTLEKEYYESMDAPEIEMKTIEQAVAEPRGGEEVWAQCSACHNAYPSAPKTLDDWQKRYNEAPANKALEDAEKTRLFHLGNNAWLGGLQNKKMPQRGLLPDTDIAHVEFYRAICWNLINLGVSIDEGDCPVDSLDDFKKPAFRTESQSE